MNGGTFDGMTVSVQCSAVAAGDAASASSSNYVERRLSALVEN